MGAEGGLEQSIKSPYTSRVLKPYIRYPPPRPAPPRWPWAVRV